jgi:hypothetical protein
VSLRSTYPTVALAHLPRHAQTRHGAVADVVNAGIDATLALNLDQSWCNSSQDTSTVFHMKFIGGTPPFYCGMLSLVTVRPRMS